MAQTKKKRKRKHRGTQAGTIDRTVRSGGGPRTKEQRRAVARQRRAERFAKPPTWRGAFTRAGLAALAFALIMVLVLDRPPLTGLALAVVMLGLYVPMTYGLDSWMYRRHQRTLAAPPRQAKPAAAESPGGAPDGESPAPSRLRRALPRRRQGE